LFDGLESKVRWDGGEDIKLPGEVFTVWAGRHFKLDEVTNRRGNHSVVILEILGIAGLSLLGKLAKGFGEGFREICGNRGFLCNDESF